MSRRVCHRLISPEGQSLLALPKSDQKASPYCPPDSSGARVVRDALNSVRCKCFKEPLTDYRKCITYEPGKRGGKPCILRLRVTVYDVLDYLTSGMTPEQIGADFDYLTLDDIRACRPYAADRKRRQLVLAA